MPVAKRLIGGLSATAEADRCAAGQVKDVALGVADDEFAWRALDTYRAVISNDNLGQFNLLAENCSLKLVSFVPVISESHSHAWRCSFLP